MLLRHSSSTFAPSSREASGYGIGAPSAASSSAAVVDVRHPIAALSAARTFRSSFIATAGRGQVSVFTVKRLTPEADTAQRRGLGSSPQPQFVTSAVATVASPTKTQATAVCAAPLLGLAGPSGRRATHYDRSIVVTGGANGLVEVFEATAAADATGMPDVTPIGSANLATVQPDSAQQLAAAARLSPSEAAVTGIAGASSHALGVSWVAVATKNHVFIFDTVALVSSAAHAIRPVVALEPAAFPEFAPSFGGSRIVDISAALASSANGANGSSTGASDAADDDEDDDRSLATANETFAPRGPTGNQVDVPAFSVTWDDGTVHVVRAMLLPLRAGRQPTHFYAVRAVDPATLFPDGTTSVTGARSVALETSGTAGARHCTVMAAAADKPSCAAVLYAQPSQGDPADADDEDSVAPAVLALPAAQRIDAIAVAETDDRPVRGGAGAAAGLAVVALSDTDVRTDLLLSRWDDAAQSLRPFRTIAAFANRATCLAVLEAARSGPATTPSTPASRASRVPSSAAGRSGTGRGPVAVVGSGGAVHLVPL